MLISDRQVNELMMVALVYVRILENLSNLDESFLSDCGKHNKVHVAKLLQEIVSQQSTELKECTPNEPR